MAVTSPAAKLLEDSLKVKVIVAVWASARLEELLLTEIVGDVVSAGTVLTAMLKVIVVGLALPAASVKTPLFT